MESWKVAINNTFYEGTAWDGTGCTKENTAAHEAGPGIGDWFLLISCCTVGPLLLGVAALVRRRPAGIVPGRTDAETEEGIQMMDLAKEATADDVIARPSSSIATRESLQTGRRRSSLGDVAAQSVILTRRVSAELQEPFKPPSNRVMYFDVWRSLCVLLVCITHHDEIYAMWNVAAVQQWVLPFFAIISGLLYGKSRVSCLEYTSRLLTYFSVGVVFNATVLIVARQMWFGVCFADDVLFQLAFVILFASGAVISAPLKNQLSVDSPEEKRFFALVNIAGYMLVVVAMFATLVILQQRNASSTLERIMRVGGEIFASLLFTSTAAFLLPVGTQGVIGWIFLFWMYGTRIAIKEDRPGLEFHFIELYVWSMVVQKIPLMGRTIVGKTMARAWPFFMVTVGLVLYPGALGRLDRFPLPSCSLRARQYIPELLAVTGFVTVPSAGAKETVPFSEELGPHMGWLSNWSLFAFVSHKAIYYLVGGVYGLPIVICTALFWALLDFSKKR